MSYTIGNINLGPQGWYCGGCGSYHSPSMMTCPFGPVRSEPKINDSTDIGVVPKDWNPPKCSKCGITLNGVMMYSCQRPGCPTGLGSSFGYQLLNETTVAINKDLD